MEIKIQWSLRVRLVLYFVVMVGLFGALMFYYVRQNAGDRYQSERDLYELHGKTLIRLFGQSQNLKFGMLSGDLKTIDENVMKLLKDPTVSYAIIYKADQVELLPKFQPGVDAASLKFPPFPATGQVRDVLAQEVLSPKSEPFLDFLIQITSEQEGAAAAPGEATALGWARIGISLVKLKNEQTDSQVKGNLLIVVVLVLGLGLVLITLRGILPPLRRLASAARRIGQGDFEVQVAVTSKDEIGLLTATFNEMVKNIAGQQSRAQTMIKNISQAIATLTETTSHLLTVSTEQASGATEQASIVQEVVSTTEEIAATATKVSEASSSVHQTAQQTYETSMKGKEFMENAMRSMQDLRQKVEKVTDQVMELVEQVQMVSGVIKIIEEISEQTDLLALNASIEAAGAGEAGKRFAVVASEVRRLAIRAMEATESVRKMVGTIQKSTSTMVMLAEDEQKAVDSSSGSVQNMGDNFQHILGMVENTRRSASEIDLIIRQQSSASQQMVSSIREVEQVAREVEKGSKDVESSMSGLSELTERLKAVISGE